MVRFLRNFFLFFVVISISLSGFFAGRKVTDLVFIESTFAADKEAPSASAGKNKNPQGERYKNIELFQKVLHFVETNYVDDVNNTQLIQGAIKGMMETLDPHSNFLDSEVFKDMKVDTSGKFGGLGIEIGMRDNVLTVIAPIEDTPAWKAGIKPLDRIVKIDGESTKGLTLSDAVAKMRGKQGAPVKLSIYRKGFDKIKDVSIKRETIKIKAVKTDWTEAGYPYLRLSTFSEDAADEIESELENFSKKGKIKGLVFDMRNNPGGLLDQAVKITSLFIDSGAVVSTIGKDPNRKEVKHVVKVKKIWTDFPIAILVNSSTASAAEIVSGALQDHGRAVIMGQPTFGKGSVQTVLDLGDDMGLKLTIARYYTPSGRSIQEKGVYPDIILEEYDQKLLEKARISRDSVRERDLPGHLIGKSEEKKPEEFSETELKSLGAEAKSEEAGAELGADEMSPTRYNAKTDFQVKEAVNYLKSFGIFKKISVKDKTAEETKTN